MAERYHLRCLTQPALLSASGDPIRFRTRKHFALLVYLAVEPRVPYRRDHLAELLWSDAPALEGRHSVAMALTVIRSKLGPAAFETGRDVVRFVYSDLTLDLDRLATDDLFASDAQPALDVVAFLDGFEIPEAPEFMFWKDRQQARLLPAIRSALIRLMDRCRRTGDFHGIESLAERMLALDHLSEEAIRAKMEARAFAGDRLTALKIYEAWEAELRGELGAEPSALVEGMALRLRRRGWERPAASPIPPVPTDQWKDRPFVGRRVEYEALYEGWEGSRQGRPGHAVVLGDSGIGKSTLVERLATAAGLEGASLARVQCYELEKAIPYAALGTLVRMLLDRPGASGAPPEALAELSRVVADVRRRYPAIPPASDVQGEAARIRLTEAFHDLALAVAEETPVILVVDDLHNADDASLAVLHLMIRRAGGQPILVLLAGRPTELRDGPTAHQLVENAGRLGIRVIELRPLTDEESHELLDAQLGGDRPAPTTTIRRCLVRAAGGYPMLLEMLLRDWEATGEGCLGISVGAMTAEPGVGGAPTQAYCALIDRVLAGLDGTARTVLNLAAILGSRMNELEMFQLLDLTVGPTMAGMARLTDLRLLRDSGGGSGLEFVNEVVRARVYLTTPSTLRTYLHGRIADRLIRSKKNDDRTIGLDLAWHCFRAGRYEEATQYLFQGAQVAIRAGALHEAERALSSALPHMKGAALKTATLLLAEVLQERGDWASSLVLLEEHHPIDIATLSSLDERNAFSLLINGRIRTCRLTEESGREAAVKLLNTIHSVDDPHAIALAAKSCATLVTTLRDPELADEFLTQFGEIQLPADDVENARLALSKAKLMFYSRRPSRLAATTLASVRDALANRPPNTTTVDMLLGLGAIHCSNGEYEGAIQEYQIAYETAIRIGNEVLAYSAAVNVALCWGRVGEYQLQQAWAKRAMVKSPLTSGYPRVLALYSLAHAHARESRDTEAIRAVAEMRSIELPESRAWVIQARALYCADILLLLGKDGEAKQMGRQGVTGANDALHSRQFAGPFARWKVKTATSDELPAVRQILNRFLHDLDSYDWRDQREIQAAAEQLESEWQCKTKTRANAQRPGT